VGKVVCFYFVDFLYSSSCRVSTTASRSGVVRRAAILIGIFGLKRNWVDLGGSNMALPLKKQKAKKKKTLFTNMKSGKRIKILFVVMVLIALLVTVYSAFAFSVASLVHEYDGRLGWANAGSTFLPWPTTPTGINISVGEFLNQSDTIYYQYIIQSGVLIVLTIISWFAVFWIALKFRKQSVLPKEPK
jgi:hypothetical protein